MTNRVLPLLVLLFIPALLQAQTEGSDFTSTGRGVSTPFVTDYHALGINPANLDFPLTYEGKRFTIGFLEFGVSVYSEALTKDEVRHNLFNEDIQEFTQQEQIDFAKEFANTATSTDIDLMHIGFSANLNKLGTIGFSITDRMNYYSIFGEQVTDILFMGYTAPYFEDLVLSNGDTIPNSSNLPQDTLDMVVEGLTPLANAQNVSDLIQGTKMNSTWIREFNLGWGKKLLGDPEDWALYGGIGLKYLVGLAYQSVEAQNGTASAYSALAPVFDIDYDEISADNPSDLGDDASNLTPVGQGYGIDLGASIIIKNKYIASLAVTDIGSVTWDGNLYEMTDTKLTSFKNEGIESVAFYEQLIGLNGSDAALQWQGIQSHNTPLSTTMRIGFGFNANNNFRVGLDIISPITDGIAEYEKTVTAIGGDMLLLPFLRLSAGFIQGGNYDFKIPVGVTFVTGAGAWEAGIASRDVITFFSEKQPTISVCTGFMRFRF